MHSEAAAARARRLISLAAVDPTALFERRMTPEWDRERSSRICFWPLVSALASHLRQLPTASPAVRLSARPSVCLSVSVIADHSTTSVYITQRFSLFGDDLCFFRVGVRASKILSFTVLKFENPQVPL